MCLCEPSPTQARMGTAEATTSSSERVTEELHRSLRPHMHSCDPTALCQLKHLTAKQHDILYAVAGCSDVQFRIKTVSAAVRRRGGWEGGMKEGMGCLGK